MIGMVQRTGRKGGDSERTPVELIVAVSLIAFADSPNCPILGLKYQKMNVMKCILFPRSLTPTAKGIAAPMI